MRDPASLPPWGIGGCGVPRFGGLSIRSFDGNVKMDEIDRRMARIMARLAEQRDECPPCEAYRERAAILEFDAGLSRGEAERTARRAHPCARHAP